MRLLRVRQTVDRQERRRPQRPSAFLRSPARGQRRRLRVVGGNRSPYPREGNHRQALPGDSASNVYAGNRRKPVNVSSERSSDLTDIHPEFVVGEVIPDIVATMPDGRRIFIEIANTHRCSQEKIEKLDAMGVEVLEIVVSQYRNHPLDDLDDIIMDIAPRTLIHSAEVKAMADEIAEERRRIEEKER